MGTRRRHHGDSDGDASTIAMDDLTDLEETLGLLDSGVSGGIDSKVLLSPGEEPLSSVRASSFGSLVVVESWEDERFAGGGRHSTFAVDTGGGGGGR